MRKIIFQFVNIWQGISNIQKAFYIGLILIIAALLIFNKKDESPPPKLALKQEKKGFKFFELNPWITELKAQQMRACKEELESAIALFDNVEKASLIIDFASEKVTKATLLIKSRDNKKISLNVIKSTLSLIIGAFPTLEIKQIAISDTTGRIYQAFNETLDRHAYELDWELKVDQKESDISFFKMFIGMIIFLSFLSCALFSLKLFQKKKKSENEFAKMMNKVNLKTLATLIVEQPASTIARMLSYMEKEKAQKLLDELPLHLQKEVQSCL